MAGFSLMLVTFMMFGILGTIYFITVFSIYYVIGCVKKLIKLKTRDNELRQRIFELKTKNL